MRRVVVHEGEVLPHCRRQACSTRWMYSVKTGLALFGCGSQKVPNRGVWYAYHKGGEVCLLLRPLAEACRHMLVK